VSLYYNNLIKINLHVAEDLGLLKSTPINAASNNHSPNRWRMLLHRGRFSANILGSVLKKKLNTILLLN